MKNNLILKISLILFITISLTSYSGNYNLSNNDTVSFLEVKGKILKNDNIYGVYKVLLICGNSVEETKIISDEKPFSFTLPKNKNYTIKVVKKGYADKVVYINAGQLKNEYSNGLFRYEFFVKMESGEGSENVGSMSEALKEDLNISNKKPEFNWSRKYCKKVTPLP